jgi:flagellar biosynthesis protein FlhA
MFNSAVSVLRQGWGNLPAGAMSLPLLFAALMGLLILPLPPLLLDLFFTINIALSLVVIFLAIAALRPLSFSIFPTVLLFGTLLRLALNVASTRLVLNYGHEGPDAAGHVIEAFGSVVIGGNYIVGIVVFAILIIINFVVVTKGAGRVSEVSARFTLDAMPGKQMAVDADLAAGLITQEDARTRRREITSEADFYGSMDGASKFVRGDAVAGLLILLINIVGGLLIGMFQHDMQASAALESYTLLAVGDGLVAQIPALLLSIATAIMVTRVSSEEPLHQQTALQFNNAGAWWVASGILALIGLVPGMPHLAFLLLALITGGAAWMLQRHKHAAAAPAPAGPAAPKELSWSDVEQADAIGLDVGYALVALLDGNRGGSLVTRIRGIRKKLTQELGFLVPAVHIRDNLELRPDAYRIRINGVVAGRGEVRPSRELAINPGTVQGELEGIPAKDPAFGLPAVWIESSQRDYARSLGYTVVDSSTAIATHLNKLLQDQAFQLMGHDEAQQLLDKVSATSPKLVEDLVPKKLQLGTLVQVLQALLQEGVSIRDMKTVLIALSAIAGKTQDAEELTAAARVALGRMIVQKIIDHGEDLPVMTLTPELEQVLHGIIKRGQGGSVPIEPEMAEGLLKSINSATEEQLALDRPAVLVTSPLLRAWLARVLRSRIPSLSVLSYAELPEDTGIRVVRSISIQPREGSALGSAR